MFLSLKQKCRIKHSDIFKFEVNTKGDAVTLAVYNLG